MQLEVDVEGRDGLVEVELVLLEGYLIAKFVFSVVVALLLHGIICQMNILRQIL